MPIQENPEKLSSGEKKPASPSPLAKNAFDAGKIFLKKKAGKAVSKIAAKLGLMKAGAAAAPATGGISFVVGTIIDFGISLLRKLWQKIKEKPENLIVIGVILGGLGFMVSAPFTIILWGGGAFFIGAGALASVPSLMASAQAGISSFFGQIASFFTSLTTLTTSTAITIFIFGIIGFLGIATFLQVIITSSAFILPQKPVLEIGEEVTFGKISDVRPSDKTGHLASQVLYALNNCGITHVNSISWNKTVDCLRNAGLPGNTEAMLSQFHYSTFSVGPGLQCVGFVRGVLAALGQYINWNGHAKDFLGYPNVEKDMTQVQVGDVIIKNSSTYGHIAILVGREEIEEKRKKVTVFRVAQADGTKNGLVLFTTFESYEGKLYAFDGFIRP